MSDAWFEKVLAKSLDVDEELQESSKQFDIGYELYDTNTNELHIAQQTWPFTQ